MPFAREDLDSNFVSIGEGFILGDQEGAQAPDIGRYQFLSKPVPCWRGGERLFRGTALFLLTPPGDVDISLQLARTSAKPPRTAGTAAALTISRAKRASQFDRPPFPYFPFDVVHTSIHLDALFSVLLYYMCTDGDPSPTVYLDNRIHGSSCYLRNTTSITC